MNDELIRLVFQITGTGSVKEATAELQKLADAAEDIAGKGGAGGGMGGKMAYLTQGISRFGQDAAQGFAMGTNALDGFSKAIMYTGNNLDQLLAGLGVTGVAGILATIGYTLAPVVIKGLQDAFGNADQVQNFASEVEKLKKHLEDMEKKPFRLMFDDAEIEETKRKIEELTKAAEELNALTGGQTKAEAESGKAFREAIVETPGGREAFDRVRKQVVDESRASGPVRAADQALEEANRKLREAEAEDAKLKSQGVPRDAMVREELQRTIREQTESAIPAAETALVKAIGDAAKKAEAELNNLRRQAERGTGEEQVAAQQEIARRLAIGGARDVAGAVDRADPAFMKEQQKAAQEFDEFAKRRQENDRLTKQRQADEQRAQEANQRQVNADERKFEQFQENVGRIREAHKNRLDQIVEQAERAQANEDEGELNQIADLMEQALGQTNDVGMAQSMVMQELLINQEIAARERAALLREAAIMRENARNIRNQFNGQNMARP